MPLGVLYDIDPVRLSMKIQTHSKALGRQHINHGSSQAHNSFIWEVLSLENVENISPKFKISELSIHVQYSFVI